jgi:hypothetical protein
MSEKKVLKCGCVPCWTPEDHCLVHDVEGFRETPKLEGRKAKCSYGCSPIPSHLSLPFFKSLPEKEMDEYYCGCFGWD